MRAASASGTHARCTSPRTVSAWRAGAPARRPQPPAPRSAQRATTGGSLAPGHRPPPSCARSTRLAADSHIILRACLARARSRRCSFSVSCASGWAEERRGGPCRTRARAPRAAAGRAGRPSAQPAPRHHEHGACRCICPRTLRAAAVASWALAAALSQYCRSASICARAGGALGTHAEQRAEHRGATSCVRAAVAFWARVSVGPRRAASRA